MSSCAITSIVWSRDFIAQGHSDSEARRLARLEFGGLDQVKEACRDARGTRWVDETAQDVRYGLRGFRKNPGFTIVAIVTLAIGVGANLAIFNVFDALLLRPLPVPHASELITMTRVQQGNSGAHFSYPQVRNCPSTPTCLPPCAASGATRCMSVPSRRSNPLARHGSAAGISKRCALTPFIGSIVDRGRRHTRRHSRRRALAQILASPLGRRSSHRRPDDVDRRPGRADRRHHAARVSLARPWERARTSRWRFMREESCSLRTPGSRVPGGDGSACWRGRRRH